MSLATPFKEENVQYKIIIDEKLSNLSKITIKWNAFENIAKTYVHVELIQNIIVPKIT